MPKVPQATDIPERHTISTYVTHGKGVTSTLTSGSECRSTRTANTPHDHYQEKTAGQPVHQYEKKKKLTIHSVAVKRLHCLNRVKQPSQLRLQIRNITMVVIS